MGSPARAETAGRMAAETATTSAKRRMRRMGRVVRSEAAPYHADPARPGIYSGTASVPAGTRAPSRSAPSGTQDPSPRTHPIRVGSRAHTRTGTDDRARRPSPPPRSCRPGGSPNRRPAPPRRRRPRARPPPTSRGARGCPRRPSGRPTATDTRRRGPCPSNRSKCACRYCAGVPRSIQYASDRNPNTGCPASITAGKTSRSIEICAPAVHGASTAGIQQVRPGVDVAGDRVLGLLPELPDAPVGVGVDEPERAGILDVVQRDRDRAPRSRWSAQHRGQVEVGEDVAVQREERLRRRAWRARSRSRRRCRAARSR